MVNSNVSIEDLLDDDREQCKAYRAAGELARNKELQALARAFLAKVRERAIPGDDPEGTKLGAVILVEYAYASWRAAKSAKGS